MSDLNNLYNIKIMEKWSKFTNMFSSIDIEKDIENILPDHYYKEWEKDNEESRHILVNLDKDNNYLNCFKKNQGIFSSLSKAKINSISYKVFTELEKNETILSTLKSFKPNRGYSNIVKYDQVKTITGRLVNKKDSPKILTLPSRCRKIFESRWQKEGELLYIDFKTLEPRVIRKINSKESPDDIYEEISSYLDFEVDRVVIKRGIISTLYGSSACIEGLSQERSGKILSATKEYFDLNSILTKANIVHDVGCRSNFFGRPIWNIKETKENKLINNYIQSTAVDIALSYFSELCGKIDLE